MRETGEDRERRKIETYRDIEIETNRDLEKVTWREIHRERHSEDRDSERLMKKEA